MGKLLPVLIVLVCAIGGAGVGFALKPGGEEGHQADGTSICAEGELCESGEDAIAVAEVMHAPDAAGDWEYVKLDKQFVVPVVDENGVASLMLLAISLEVKPGRVESVYAKEPRIRDSFLTVLFQHANSGGFDGRFTDDRQLKDVRANLRRAARVLFGAEINDVLLTDIIRQDL